jgi:hypothetical protein
MFCPECQAEYRQGFTRCADCDVDLVYELPPEPNQASSVRGISELDGSTVDRQLIWKGVEQNACVAICRDLLKNDIAYTVAQIPEWHEIKKRSRIRYEISVAKTDYQRTRVLLRIEGEFWNDYYTEDEDDSQEAAANALSLKPDNSLPDNASRNEAFLKPWYPEDATMEIWAQDGDDLSCGIQMALKENQIHCRMDLHGGVRKVLVTPEDEPRARQIVREIIEGVELN